MVKSRSQIYKTKTKSDKSQSHESNLDKLFDLLLYECDVFGLGLVQVDSCRVDELRQGLVSEAKNKLNHLKVFYQLRNSFKKTKSHDLPKTIDKILKEVLNINWRDVLRLKLLKKRIRAKS